MLDPRIAEFTQNGSQAVAYGDARGKPRAFAGLVAAAVFDNRTVAFLYTPATGEDTLFYIAPGEGDGGPAKRAADVRSLTGLGMAEEQARHIVDTLKSDIVVVPYKEALDLRASMGTSGPGYGA